MNVIWVLYWRGSRRTKFCGFQCQMAVDGDKGYLVYAVGIGWARCSSQYKRQFDIFCAILYLAIIWYFGNFGFKLYCNNYMNFTRALYWGGRRSMNSCFFWRRLVAAGDAGQLLPEATAVWIISRSINFSLAFCNIKLLI